LNNTDGEEDDEEDDEDYPPAKALTAMLKWREVISNKQMKVTKSLTTTRPTGAWKM
jgi:hypothetical protein